MKAVTVSYDQMEPFDLTASERVILQKVGRDGVNVPVKLHREIIRILENHQVRDQFYDPVLYQVGMMIFLQHTKTEADKELTKFNAFIRALTRTPEIDGVTIIIKGSSIPRLTVNQHPILLQRLVDEVVNNLKRYQLEANPAGRPSGKADPALNDRIRNLGANLCRIGLEKRAARKVLFKIMTAAGIWPDSEHYRKLPGKMIK